MAINQETLNSIISGLGSMPKKSEIDTPTNNIDVVATETNEGLMSAEDKVKLNAVETGANNYVLPTAGKDMLGGVKTTSDETSAEGYIPTPIIDGVPYYKYATYELPVASADTLGGVKIGSNINIAEDGTISVSAEQMEGVIPISNGGTGATNIHQARINLKTSCFVVTGNTASTDDANNGYYLAFSALPIESSMCTLQLLISPMSSSYVFEEFVVHIVLNTTSTTKNTPIGHIGGIKEQYDILDRLYVSYNSSSATGGYYFWYKNPSANSNIKISILQCTYSSDITMDGLQIITLNTSNARTSLDTIQTSTPDVISFGEFISTKLVSTSMAGYMSAEDKAKLDSVDQIISEESSRLTGLINDSYNNASSTKVTNTKQDAVMSYDESTTVETHTITKPNGGSYSFKNTDTIRTYKNASSTNAGLLTSTDYDYLHSIPDALTSLENDITEELTPIINTHIGDTNNPHSVTKDQLGLENVENKSSSTIRSEITSKNVTDALGYTPVTPTEFETHTGEFDAHIADISNPHSVTKDQIGLDKVENKSSEDIRGEITSDNVTTALGYDPVTPTEFGSHASNTSNPHSVTKEQVGLGNVENKSSATIRSEITSDNVTTALGYTPVTPTELETHVDDFDTHISDTTNPHSVTKDQIGLANVENKSSSTIRSEITSKNVTDALGYTPVTPTEFETHTDAFGAHIANVTNPHSVTKDQIGLANVENKSSEDIRAEITPKNVTDALGYTPVTPTEFGSHASNTSNPHSVTKEQVGLSNVENKSSETIRSEITSKNVTDALTFIPADSADLSGHVTNTENPHSVTKEQLGLGNVENKSSATIRSEITSENVTAALGYDPVTPTEFETHTGEFDAHIANVTNPHSVTKDQIGLDKVENKSSEDIRAEITPKNVTDALGYTPAKSLDLANHTNDTANPHNVTKEQVGLSKVENKSSSDIIGEITAENITTALGYDPVTPTEFSSHTSDTTNPHNVTKDQIGLGNVENKSSEDIRGEITSKNVTDALTFIPADSVDLSGHVTDTKNPHAVTKEQVGLSNVENKSSSDIRAEITPDDISTALTYTPASSTDLMEHTVNISNPHSVTKEQLGLGNVENKSSADIRGELTATDITTALGYDPAIPSDFMSHISDISNPHSVTKDQVGLSKVENKSSETIRSEITSKNVTDALGYTPVTPTEFKTHTDAFDDHIANVTNPHNVTKNQIGLDKVENKSASDIIGEITAENVTDALGYTPVTPTEFSSHVTNTENPHSVTKEQVGLDKVENKSSSDIRSEITSKNVTDALTYTPANSTDLSSHTSNITNPHNVTKDQVGLSKVENKSASDIIGEITAETITDALTFTPADSLDLSAHTSNISNPHSVTKDQIGLGNVENKSSADIRGEITSDNVTGALTYIPADSEDLLAHMVDDTNPHSVTKEQVGLDKVENKSSSDIRAEITSKNVTDALGYTPVTPTEFSTHTGEFDAHIADISNPHSVTKEQIGLGNVENKSASDIIGEITSKNITTALGYTPVTPTEFKTHTDAFDDHIANVTNPHSVTKDQIGLGNVENKSSSDIRSEITSKNVTDALTYTPAKSLDLTNHTSDTANPHSVTKEQVGLGNVENKSSATIRSEITAENVTDALTFIPADSADLSAHVTNISNPHSVTKDQIGLDKVENKSSADIRGEITSDNVTTALGYTPPSSVEFSQTLTSGVKIGVLSVSGVDVDLYAPEATSGITSQYTTKLVVGSSEESSENGIASNGSVYLNLFDDDILRNSHNIKGSSGITITSNANGDIDISGVVMTGSTNTTAGSSGLVPEPAAGTEQSFLRGDGTWAIPNDTTYTAGSGLTLSGTEISHSNSITEGTISGDSDKTLSFGGTFTIPSITYDAQGHITAVSTTTMKMPLDPNVDTKVTNTLDTTTKAYVTGTTSATTNTGTQIFDTGVYLDTTAGTLTATVFNGALTGNADTATRLATAHKISLAGSVTGDVTFAGDTDVTIITETNHTHDYAGSATSGGSATSAVKLDTSAGSETQPVYFSDGKPVATTYTLGKDVPSDAVFTDTVYTHPTYTSHASGLYKVTINNMGHVSAVADIVKSDITDLGIPGQDTTYDIVSTTSDGLCPKRGGTTTKFLRDDGTWAVPPDTDTVYTHPTGSGYKHIPSGGSSGQILGWSSSGTAAWIDAPDSGGSTVSFTQNLTSGTQVGTLTIDGSDIILYAPSDTNSINTAGSSNTSKKIFLVGAESQSTYATTYSHDTAYVGTDGHLYSNSKQVVNLSDTQALTNKTYNGYTLGAACAKGVDTSAKNGSANLITSGAVYSGLAGKAASSHTHTVVNGHTVESDVPADAKFTDTTYGVVSTSANGLCPKRGGTTTKFLRDDGTWAVPTLDSSALSGYLPLTGGTTTGNTALANNFRVIAGDYVRVQFFMNGAWSSCIWSHATEYYPIFGSTTTKVKLYADSANNAYVNDYRIYNEGYQQCAAGVVSKTTTSRNCEVNVGFRPSAVLVTASGGPSPSYGETSTGFYITASAANGVYEYAAFR